MLVQSGRVRQRKGILLTNFQEVEMVPLGLGNEQ